jgi:hypothetical protein
VSGGRWQVSPSGGVQPVWARDGRELFYFAPDGALMRVAIARAATWQPGAPAKALDARYVISTAGNILPNYDVAPDGRFLMLKTRESATPVAPPQLVVVEHFDEELKRLAPLRASP